MTYVFGFCNDAGKKEKIIMKCLDVGSDVSKKHYQQKQTQSDKSIQCINTYNDYSHLVR